jgi:uncharacterized membrane protein required for colicin V production
MISLVMLVILAACAAGMYLKGTLIRAVAMIFNTILAGLVALAFHELLAGYLIKYVGLPDWAPLIGFVLLFVVVFALLQTAAMQIHKEKTDMGLWPERVGRVVCGLLLGYLLFGNLLLAAAMAPIPSTYPYPRFGDRNPNPSQPAKPMLNPDGFVAGLFNVVSQGSLSAISQPRSFGMLHAGFVDSLYLNRQKPASDVPAATKDPAIEVPKGGIREAPATLRGEDGQPPSVPADRKLMIVRVGIRKTALADAGKFTLSQWRLVCGPRGLANPLAGKGQSVYPLGLVQANKIIHKPLDEVITLVAKDIRGNANAKYYDLAFAVPSDLIPILIAFKRNNLEQLSAPVSADEATMEALPEEAQSAAPAQPGQGDQAGQAPADSSGARQGGRGGRTRNRNDSGGTSNNNSGGSGLSGAGQQATGGALEGINPQ